MWIVDREDHPDVSSSVENVVSNPDNCLFSFVVCGFFLVPARGRVSGLQLRTGRVRIAVLCFGCPTVAVVVRLVRTDGGTRNRQHMRACCWLVY